MKKKLSYRDKLIELAYIYNVKEIQDYTKRRKNLSKSLLDQISGIGRSRKRALLNHFGSAKSVEAASFEDLKSVDGIEEKVAKKIHDFFHED